ncbi:ATP-binding cassette domain-containing protein [Fodinicurvata sp. EGI_FJ10296]|uniref:ABC transporter ATP-binding protein n=1 Tax=Fodinicurvata sp. EGI_FJ10296 TaxID=3231908 RepID=UPI0034551823
MTAKLSDGDDDGDPAQPVIRVRGLRTQFGSTVIHDGLDMDVRRGEVLGVVGGSGTGKSVLMREIIGLQSYAKGTIEVYGHDISTMSEVEIHRLQGQWGVLFQDGALFSSMTVEENIMVPLAEHTGMKRDLMREIAQLKVAMVGLPPDAGTKVPSELSGGMRKRAGLARALALDPGILFLDEPTAGLDPIGAAAFDDLIGTLSRNLELTVVMVTHDMDSLLTICDRIAALIEKKVVVDTWEGHKSSQHPWLQAYFNGVRARSMPAAASMNE